MARHASTYRGARRSESFWREGVLHVLRRLRRAVVETRPQVLDPATAKMKRNDVKRASKGRWYSGRVGDGKRAEAAQQDRILADAGAGEGEGGLRLAS